MQQMQQRTRYFLIIPKLNSEKLKLRLSPSKSPGRTWRAKQGATRGEQIDAGRELRRRWPRGGPGRGRSDQQAPPATRGRGFRWASRARGPPA